MGLWMRRDAKPDSTWRRVFIWADAPSLATPYLICSNQIPFIVDLNPSDSSAMADIFRIKGRSEPYMRVRNPPTSREESSAVDSPRLGRAWSIACTSEGTAGRCFMVASSGVERTREAPWPALAFQFEIDGDGDSSPNPSTPDYTV